MKQIKTLIVLALLLLATPLAAPVAAGWDTCGYGQAVYQSSSDCVAANAGVIEVAQSGYSNTGSGGGMITPSTALRQAMRQSPGSQALGVRLLSSPRLLYAVKLKSGSRVYRVLVDAKTGRIVGQ